ncbi:MAG: leucine-rich repeat protein [Paludibacteraceae bacterium]|nr:leucine-rich repeat protein [Paludibacteraceae bacterium]
MSTSELTENSSNPSHSILLQKGATSIVECRWEDGRKVFVKRLRKELADEEQYREAFRKEFEIGKTFDCPSLVKYIRMEDDCIIEEYIDGMPLDIFIRENHNHLLNEKNLRQMLLQLLEGLEYLHERQILHLDLKPANIMITRVGNHVKIVDFGFSYTDSFILSTGGTKGFAAPEQFEKGAELNVTADIYALGCILIYINKEIGLPKKYNVIAKRCCEEKPEERFASVDEVRKAIIQKDRALNILFVLFTLITIVGITLFCSNRYQVPNEVFCVNDIYYRAVSDSTLKVVKPDTTTAGLDLVIPENVTYKGHTYQVTSIDSLAYSQCKDMIALTLSKSIDSIDYRAFSHCYNISNVYIPDNVSYIAREAFRRCENLKAVRLPSGIDCLEKGVFSLCHELEEIDVPANVKVLKQDVFGECTKLRNVQLHEGLEVIERGVFWECRSLQSLVIPSTVKEIGDYAFWGCTSLTDLYMKSNVPPRITAIFKNYNIRIHVPKGSEHNYKNALFWKDNEIIAE